MTPLSTGAHIGEHNRKYIRIPYYKNKLSKCEFKYISHRVILENILCVLGTLKSLIIYQKQDKSYLIYRIESYLVKLT